MRRIIFAIGGNSLIPSKSNSVVGYEVQKRTLRKTLESISFFIDKDMEVAITHGNGPQVGYHLLRNHYASKYKEENFPEIPLDICNALTQGEIGYMIVQELRRFTLKRSVVVLTRVEVDKEDPAFKNPTKPIGPFYTSQEKEALEKETHWIFKEIEPGKFRRVVPSPFPLGIVEGETIKNLIEQGITVISCGGGGIPVIKEDGYYKGVAAVIDKDRVSALLGEVIHADTMIITTNIDAVYINFRKANEERLREVSIPQLKSYLMENQFGDGSMKPKIEAAIYFIEHGGKQVIITSPEGILSAIEGKTGTLIHA